MQQLRDKWDFTMKCCIRDARAEGERQIAESSSRAADTLFEQIDMGRGETTENIERLTRSEVGRSELARLQKQINPGRENGFDDKTLIIAALAMKFKGDPKGLENTLRSITKPKMRDIDIEAAKRFRV